MDNPVLTIGGVMPGGSEVTSWRNGMNHPTASVGTRGSYSRGPSLSIAGVMPGSPQFTHWRTAFPSGEAVYVNALRAAEAKAALAAKVTELPERTVRRTAGQKGPRKAA